MNIFANLFQDWSVNKRNPKARFVLVMFRLAQIVRRSPKPILFFGIPYLVTYRIFVEWVLGIELPWNLRLGTNAQLHHGVGLVVNDHVLIGSNVLLRHSTTIGVKQTSAFGSMDVPVIGDYVDIGSNVVIIGSIYVGDYAQIGAGSVVVKDVPRGGVVVGNPARLLRIRQDLN